MLELTKKQTTGRYAEICIRVPIKQAGKIAEATKSFLRLAGHEVREINDEGEELFSVEEVFPNRHPGKLLRGARVRENLTQAQLADKAGLKPHHISEMENRKRPIGKDVAKRLAEALNMDYRILL
ncbi:MAG: transcriptional regulator [Desulfovibrio sp.]|nr:transcriptional regulator [Desulfovibrio sp.]|tara:strand:- start:1012 stop:1386 length:375 start_codon:yes stop_codon:yes gene_type:complete